MAPPLLPLRLALTEAGLGDLLFDMIVREDGPGYAGQLKKGATTLAEAWDAEPASSQNHPMLGHVEEWFYRGLGGLWTDPSGPGFKKTVIKPQVVRGLEWVKVHHMSPYGRIASEWRREGGKLAMSVSVPVNTTATVFVPARDSSAVTEGGRPAAGAEGVRLLREEGGRAVFEVGSGSYRFESVETGR